MIITDFIKLQKDIKETLNYHIDSVDETSTMTNQIYVLVSIDEEFIKIHINFSIYGVIEPIYCSIKLTFKHDNLTPTTYSSMILGLPDRYHNSVYDFLDTFYLTNNFKRI